MESETDGSDEPAEEQRLAAEAYHLNSCDGSGDSEYAHSSPEVARGKDWVEYAG